MANVFNDSAVGGGASGFGFPMGFAGGGWGGGGDGIGLIALLALLGGGNFGGRRGGGDDCCEDNTALLGAIAALINNSDGNADTAAILSKLASLEGSIPAVGSQLQLALAGLSANLTSQLNSIQVGQLIQSNAIQKEICDVDTNVDRSTTLVTNAIGASEARLALLINGNTIQDLRDDKVILSNKLAEERSERNRDHDRHGIEITTIVNQQQNNQMFQKLENDNARFHGMILELLQVNRATNQAINIGAGTQTANPLNSQTNVKA